jgi:hypothetical protein
MVSPDGRRKKHPEDDDEESEEEEELDFQNEEVYDY